MIRTINICLMLALSWPLFARDVKSRAAKTTMIGYVDEQPGAQYVLREGEQLSVLARLQPLRFKNETFARYVGCKVEVGGTSVPGGDIPIVKVERIRAADSSCKVKEQGWRTEKDLQP